MADSGSDSDSTFEPGSSSPLQDTDQPSRRKPSNHDKPNDLGPDGGFSNQSPAYGIALTSPHANRISEASPSDPTGHLGQPQLPSSPPLMPVSPDPGSDLEGGKNKLPQIPVQLLNNPFASEPTYFTRPNRFFGPASTWRSWTRNDREIVGAIERERATNLSRHLFNAFALKKAAFRAEATSKILASSDDPDREAEKRGRKRTRTGTERIHDGHARSPKEQIDEYDSSAPFEPPRLWTAWPLPATDIPRLQSLPPLGDGDFRMASPYSANVELEDCLIALTTRHAKEMWQNRGWEHPPASPSTSSLKVPKTLPQRSGSTLTASSDEEDNATAQTRLIRDKSESSAPEDGVAMWSSQVFAPSPSLSSTTQKMDEGASLRVPVPMADDTKARTLLLSAVRHTISNLDRLLSAARISRQSYAFDRHVAPSRIKSSSRGGGGTGFADKSPRDQDQHDSRSQSNGQSHQTHLPGLAKDLQILPSASHPYSPGRQSLLRPRDWSSIIGLASISCAFNAETISRASKRCASLFEENMLFRTFHETVASHSMTAPSHPGPNLEAKQDNGGPWFEEDFVIDDETEEELLEGEDVFDRAGVTEDNIDEVQKDYRQNAHIFVLSSKPCSQCVGHKAKCEAPPHHLPNEIQGLVQCRRCIKLGHGCSGIKAQIKERTRIQDTHCDTLRLCPFPHCERSSIPFKRQSHLKQHISIVHKHERLPASKTHHDSRMGSWSSTRDSSAPPSQKPYHCPIGSCTRSLEWDGKPFPTGSRMYTHVRRQHPEVDIEAVKQLETMKRGERRGRRAAERSSRSQSQSNRIPSEK